MTQIKAMDSKDRRDLVRSYVERVMYNPSIAQVDEVVEALVRPESMESIMEASLDRNQADAERRDRPVRIAPDAARDARVAARRAEEGTGMSSTEDLERSQVEQGQKIDALHENVTALRTEMTARIDQVHGGLERIAGLLDQLIQQGETD